jgi:hypothetical protein
VAPANCTIDWSSALSGGASLGIDRLVVALDGSRAPHVLDEASCHPRLGGFYAAGGVGETILTLCASTCAAISPDKALLLHPICGY